MAKKVTRIAKLQFVAGQSKPGPELAGLGIDMVGFTREFNAKTQDRGVEIVPVIITAYDDRTFDFELKTTPASYLIKKAAEVEKGSAKPNLIKVASVTVDQLKEIAEYKMVDLNTKILDNAVEMMIGSAKSLGITVDGVESSQLDQEEINKSKKQAASLKAFEDNMTQTEDNSSAEIDRLNGLDESNEEETK